MENYTISKALWLIEELEKCSIELERKVIDESYLEEIKQSLHRQQRKVNKYEHY